MIKYLRFCEYAVSKVGTEVLGCSQVYRLTKKSGKLGFHLRHREQSDFLLWFVFDQQVYITAGMGIPMKSGPEQS